MVVAKNIQEQQDDDPRGFSPGALFEQPEVGVPPDLGLSVDEQLALSQASRVEAESERQRVAKGIVDATKQACQELIADGEKVLKKAKWLESEAERKHQAAEIVIGKANTARAEADAYSQKVKSDADAFRSDAESHGERAVAEARHLFTRLKKYWIAPEPQPCENARNSGNRHPLKPSKCSARPR